MKRLVIFDLDGVIIDSREYESFLERCKKKSQYKDKFKKYFEKIGMPFENICKKTSK